MKKRQASLTGINKRGLISIQTANRQNNSHKTSSKGRQHMLQRILGTFTLLMTLMITPLIAAPKPDKAIFLNSLPQAIDFYPTMGLYDFYRLTTFRVSEKTFPKDTIQAKAFERFIASPQTYINNGSVPPSKANMDLLANLGKMVLHVRDPRDALVSWIAYTDLHFNHPLTLGLIYPAPPADYFGWSYEKKADWQIDHYYSYAMVWLNQWAYYLTHNPPIEVLVTTFEDMATQPLTFFREIVQFYGTDPALFTDKNVQPLTQAQFRASVDDIGQWTRKLTPAQQRRVSDMLDENTVQFFKWKK